ncbi:MAG: phosphoglucosamine mutase [Defluviitaleaceae bacterium]|nr:phosphoglucosamine mutase [Defluviitaleaceae bacterium]
MGNLFGTDGVRGLANAELTPELAFRLGRAGAYMLTKQEKASNEAPRILVGKDSRLSGDMLEAALTAGMCSIGAHVFHAGVLPTPAVAYLVRHYKMDAGVMISASHNLMPDNGIKFFNSQGYKLPDAVEEEIEKLISDFEAGKDNLPRPTGADVGTITSCKTAVEDFASYLTSIFSGLNLNGLKIALDCANGATSQVAPMVFKQLGAQVQVLSNKPDGTNINENCGSTHMENLQKFVKENSTDIGLAFDGDGDRMLAVCEKGGMIDGDKILAICGLNLQAQGKLNTIVATVMSNQGLEILCKEKGIKLHRTDVGDRYVLEKMLQDDLPLGGEQSGHIIFKKHSTTGDGILTGLHLLSVMVQKNESISTLAGVMDTLPQVLINATVPNDKKATLHSHPVIQKAQAEIESNLAGAGRILVRPSGTEPLVRVMIEGRDIEQIRKWARDLADIIEKNIG